MAITYRCASAGLRGVVAMFFWSGWISPLMGDVVPQKDWRESLGSDDFKRREEAQSALLLWGRQNPREAKEWFYLRAAEETDPEIRRRCQAILRDLIIDEYLKEGDGYAGITMQVMPVVVPGDAGQRFGIRVTQVVPGAAAARAGVVVGDVIVGLDGKIWREANADREFQSRVRSQKPGGKVVLKLLRDNKEIDASLILGRRPAGLDGQVPFGMKPEDASRMDQEAKDAYFKRWLEQRKARK